MDAESFAAFYGNTARPLWTYIYRVTRNRTDADDIMQEAFCRLLEGGRAFTGEQHARRYLYRIASNLLVDRWRQRGRERAWDEERERTASAAEPAGQDALRLLGRLAPRERALLWLAHVEGYTHDEIAEAFGLAIGSVRVLLFRARARLREHLKESHGGRPNGTHESD